MPDAFWPAFSFGPVNLWRVTAAWRLGAAVVILPRTTDTVRPLARSTLAHPQVQHLLRHR
jgi:hypothetical protein